MKIFYIATLLFITHFSYSQNVPIDFEAGGNGLNWTWTTFENDTNPPLEIVVNPSSWKDFIKNNPKRSN